LLGVESAVVKKFHFVFVVLLAGAALSAADHKAWPWSGDFSSKAVTLLLVGDINIENRSDPATAFANVRDTLAAADLVYGNLEGLLVKSQGPDKDIPDKSGWVHIGPEAVEALKTGNIKVVGVANNVAWGPSNILQSLKVLDAAGIAHTGAGKNLDAAHKPAIVERKGVKFGFLQYTAKWYAQDQQIATATRPGVARLLSRDGTALDFEDLARLQQDIRLLRPLVDILIVSSHNRDGAGKMLPPEVLAEARPPAVPPSPDDPSLTAPIPLGDRGTQAEPYEVALAHAAIEAGADIVYGHGSHVLQGVEVFRHKAIMYCLGNFATDWIRMRPNRDGLVARVVVERKRIARVSLVPVTRDTDNNVVMLDPAKEGSVLIHKLEKLSSGLNLPVDGHEAVLVETVQPRNHD
jgi:poly-gamma-glutamate capsule biosynthesis protein CapA/YwtB (metallophosphatase superfamily)